MSRLTTSAPVLLVLALAILPVFAAGNTTFAQSPVIDQPVMPDRVHVETLAPEKNADGSVMAFDAGAHHTCVLTSTGGVRCWGGNGYGQLGTGNKTFFSVPVSVGGLADVSAVSAGDEHTCALTGGGAVKCFGYGSATPAPIQGLTSGVLAVGTWSGHSCAVTSGGGLKCWGSNLHGKLGNGTTSDSPVPVDVVGLDDGVSTLISGGWYHTCAVMLLGGVKCWGENMQGQLGTGVPAQWPPADSFVPVDVQGLDGVVAIGSGFSHACALTDLGGVKCWGSNWQGQLGNGSDSVLNSWVPLDVQGLTSGVTAITVGGAHSCALTAAGAVKCWGTNLDGQLGEGRTMDYSWVPVNMNSLSQGVAAISAGVAHTCVAMTGGGIKCWGRNYQGQLGNGRTAESPVPVDILVLEPAGYLPVMMNR